jgi:hypothetical protein
MFGTGGPAAKVLLEEQFTKASSGLYYKTITIVIDTPSVVKSDAPNCSVTY